MFAQGTWWVCSVEEFNVLTTHVFIELNSAMDCKVFSFSNLVANRIIQMERDDITTLVISLQLVGRRVFDNHHFQAYTHRPVIPVTVIKRKYMTAYKVCRPTLSFSVPTTSASFWIPWAGFDAREWMYRNNLIVWAPFPFYSITNTRAHKLQIAWHLLQMFIWSIFFPQASWKKWKIWRSRRDFSYHPVE